MCSEIGSNSSGAFSSCAPEDWIKLAAATSAPATAMFLIELFMIPDPFSAFLDKIGNVECSFFALIGVLLTAFHSDLHGA
jgi:hypothetical protein